MNIKALLFCAKILLCAFAMNGQTYNADIAPLLYENCTSCHRQGGIGPMSLMNYIEVKPYASVIKTYVNSGEMPPWPPDNSYQKYAHDKSLTPAEVQLINDWVNNGSQEGSGASPIAPVYTNNRFLNEIPDLILSFPQKYMSKASLTADDYVCITLPSGLTTSKYLKAIEVIPGNPEIVHHALVYTDQGGLNATDTSGLCAGPVGGKLLAGFAPGEVPTIFPNGATVKMGTKIDAGADFILAMHYPEGSYGKFDSTSINLYFYDDTVSSIREITATPILENWNFCIKADSIQTVNSVYPSGVGAIPVDISVLSVFPHMHLLGQDFLVYAITPMLDTIPLINVPQWDFEWQGFYFFKNMIKVPAGSKLYGISTYNNTATGHHGHQNPNNPPIDVCAGLNTSDEMHLVYFHYTPYQVGDELYDMDSLLKLPQNTTGLFPKVEELDNAYALVYPNPFTKELNIEYFVEETAAVEINIYDASGKSIKKYTAWHNQRGIYKYNWSRQTELSSGRLYFVKIQVGDKNVSKKVILRE